MESRIRNRIHIGKLLSFLKSMMQEFYASEYDILSSWLVMLTIYKLYRLFSRVQFIKLLAVLITYESICF